MSNGMQDKLDSEIRYVFRERLQSAESLRTLCRTADEWHDGVKSRMKQFATNEGLLATGLEYKQMADEVSGALKEVSQTQYRIDLEKLRDFGRDMHSIDKTLRAIAKNAADATKAGVADQYISGVAAIAVMAARS